MARARDMQAMRDQRVFEFQHGGGERVDIGVAVQRRGIAQQFQLFGLDQTQLEGLGIISVRLAFIEVAQPVRASP